jgi:hypothetical protein
VPFRDGNFSIPERYKKGVKVSEVLEEQTRRRPRMTIPILIWMIHSLWEPYAVFNLQQPNWKSDPDTLKYFLLFHTGDLNNSFGLVVILYWLLRRFAGRSVSFLISVLTTSVIFTVIEWSDPKDLPFAYLGIALFVFGISQKPRW